MTVVQVTNAKTSPVFTAQEFSVGERMAQIAAELTERKAAVKTTVPSPA